METQEQFITKSQSRMNAIMATLHLIFYYGIALLIWGFALKRSLLWFSLSGVLLGFIISLLFVAPVMASQKTVSRTKDMMFAAGALWGNLAIVIGILGILTFIIRVIFFH